MKYLLALVPYPQRSYQESKIQVFPVTVCLLLLSLCLSTGCSTNYQEKLALQNEELIQEKNQMLQVENLREKDTEILLELFFKRVSVPERLAIVEQLSARSFPADAHMLVLALNDHRLIADQAIKILGRHGIFPFEIRYEGNLAGNELQILMEECADLLQVSTSAKLVFEINRNVKGPFTHASVNEQWEEIIVATYKGDITANLNDQYSFRIGFGNIKSFKPYETIDFSEFQGQRLIEARKGEFRTKAIAMLQSYLAQIYELPFSR